MFDGNSHLSIVGLVEKKLKSENSADSSLVFGTAGLMGAALTDRGRVNLLEHCFDLGISHFDTAPLYGMGEAENVVGKFIQPRRSQVTISTKFGFAPATAPFYLKPLRPFVRYLNRRVAFINTGLTKARKLKQRGANKSPTTSGNGNREPGNQSNFDISSVERDLDQSLRKLKTDYVDHYLFHEAKRSDVSEELLEELRALVKKGKILHFGLATSRDTTMAILNDNREFNGTVQLAHSFDKGSKSLPFSNDLILHSILNNGFFAAMSRESKSNPGALAALAEELGVETTAVPQAFCLAHAVYTHHRARLLFSSRHEHKICETTRLVDRIKKLDLPFSRSFMERVNELNSL